MTKTLITKQFTHTELNDSLRYSEISDLFIIFNQFKGNSLWYKRKKTFVEMLLSKNNRLCASYSNVVSSLINNFL